MINISVTKADYLDMRFNVSKSVIVRIGSTCKRGCVSVTLNGPNYRLLIKLDILGADVK